MLVGKCKQNIKPVGNTSENREANEATGEEHIYTGCKVYDC